MTCQPRSLLKNNVASVYLLLTSGLRSYRVEPVVDRFLIHKILHQYLRLQQRYVAFLEVDDSRAGDVLTFVCAHRYHCRQTPLRFTHTKHRHSYLRKVLLSILSRCPVQRICDEFRAKTM